MQFMTEEEVRHAMAERDKLMAHTLQVLSVYLEGVDGYSYRDPRTGREFSWYGNVVAFETQHGDYVSLPLSLLWQKDLDAAIKAELQRLADTKKQAEENKKREAEFKEFAMYQALKAKYEGGGIPQ
jgi:hypothetical protein